MDMEPNPSNYLSTSYENYRSKRIGLEWHISNLLIMVLKTINENENSFNCIVENWIEWTGLYRNVQWSLAKIWLMLDTDNMSW